MSRFALFAVLVSLLLASAYGASLSYNIYSDASCSSQVASGSQGTQTGTVNGQSIQVATCFGISGLPGSNFGQAACTGTGGSTVGAINTYTDNQCTNAVGIYTIQTGGQCGKLTYVNASAATGSATISCSGAFSFAAASLPLLAALSLLASLIM